MVESTQLAVKLTTLFTLLVSSLLAGLAPLIIDAISKRLVKKSASSSETKNKIQKCTRFVFTAMDCIQGFAAGILLGAGLLHLLPEASEELREVLEKWGASEKVLDYPWAMLACIVTLTVLYFLDTVVVEIASGIIGYRMKKVKQSSSKPKAESPSSSPEREETQQVDAKTPEYNTFIESKVTDVTPCTTEHDHHYHHHHTDDHDHGVAHVASQVISGIMLWSSISAHAFFEGLGLGTTTEEAQMWSLFAAIISHKLVESFACGFVVFKSMKSKPVLVVIFMILFSLMTPVGIAIGIGISSAESLGFSFAQQLILSFASGAFLFVAIFEIMASHSHFEGESKEKDKAREAACGKPVFNLFRFMFFLVGLTLSAVLKAFELHDHAHE